MINLNQVRDIIESCTYSQRNILETGLNVEYSLRDRIARLDPYYRFDQLSSTGTCAELMEYTYQEIKKSMPDIHVTRVLGTEPTYFSGRNSVHAYLLLSEDNVMNGSNATAFPLAITEVMAKNPLVVDPSFKKIGLLGDLNYKIRILYNENFKINWSNKVEFSTGRAPLEFDSNGALTFMIINFDRPEIFSLGFKEAGKVYEFYDLDSDELKMRIRDEEMIRQYVDLFRSVEKKSLDELGLGELIKCGFQKFKNRK